MHPTCPSRRTTPLRLALACLATTTLAGCATSHHGRYDRYYAASGAYRAPGTAADPWGPYIRSASRRFAISEQWIRAVIHQESGGHEYLDGRPITSSAGAMGLMQLMPQTYADMQNQYNLGSDPYEPQDNIYAGTGYIRILSAKYGAPAFLAAYNAGPQRLEDYLYRGRPLPNETVNYVASITPNLGSDVAMTGPLATYASADQLNALPAAGPGANTLPVEVAEAPEPATPCPTANPDDAYDPTQPCPAPHIQQVAYRPVPQPASPGSLPPPAPVLCDSNSAYDPNTPCKIPTPMPYPTQQPQPTQQIVYAPRHIAAPPPAAASAYGPYAIQVGAFTSSGQARFATTMARQAAYTPLAGAQSLVQPTPSLGRGIFYRARLAGLSQNAAAQACTALRDQGMACLIVPPGH